MTEVPDLLFREYGMYLDKMPKEVTFDTSKDSLHKYLVDLKRVARGYAKK